MKRFSTIGLTLGLILGIAPIAYAQNVYLDADSDTSAGLGGTVTVDLDVSADAEANATGTAGEQENMDSSVSSDVEGKGEIGIMITRAAASSDATSVAITSPAAVETNTDLSAYVTTVVRSDNNIGSAEVSGSAVSLAYNVRARLLGVFPVLMPVRATVEAGGETTITYPWYAFLATVDSASLESNVSVATAATVSASANTAFSATTQAVVLSEIHAALKSHLEASLAVEARAKAITTSH